MDELIPMVEKILIFAVKMGIGVIDDEPVFGCQNLMFEV